MNALALIRSRSRDDDDNDDGPRLLCVCIEWIH